MVFADQTFNQSQLDVTLDLPMPQSPDAERAVLGAILINNNVWFRVGNLSADHFFKDAHRTIYNTIALMIEEGAGDIEPLTLKEELAKRGQLDQIGGVAYISSLLDMVPDVANVERYAAIVERMAKKRAGVIVGNRIMRDSLDPESEPEEVATAAIALLSPQATREERQARPLADVLVGAFTRQRTLAASDKSVAYDCGMPFLLEHKVFYPTFIVVTAERGTGKSALMVEWSRTFARNGHGNVMFSLESFEEEIGLRYATAETGIPHRYMRDWRVFDDSNRAAVAQCQRDAAQQSIFIARNLRTVEDIVLEIKRLKAMHDIDVAFIDYIQLVGSNKRFERDELKFAHISQTLLSAALDTRVAICAFSQVNKTGDVAYADSIEKAARVRMHFDRPYREDRDKNCHVDFQIKKNNEERTGGFLAHFCEITQRWSEGPCTPDKHGRAVATQRTLV